MRIVNVPLTSLVNVLPQAAHSDRMSIAVAPQSYIYSHFRHVSGVPAPDGQSGAPLTSLRMLDIMIERQQARLREGQGSLLNFTA